MPGARRSSSECEADLPGDQDARASDRSDAPWRSDDFARSAPTIGCPGEGWGARVRMAITLDRCDPARRSPDWQPPAGLDSDDIRDLMIKRVEQRTNLDNDRERGRRSASPQVSTAMSADAVGSSPPAARSAETQSLWIDASAAVDYQPRPAIRGQLRACGIGVAPTCGHRRSAEYLP
jgi:hypothetical protein